MGRLARDRASGTVLGHRVVVADVAWSQGGNEENSRAPVFLFLFLFFGYTEKLEPGQHPSSSPPITDPAPHSVEDSSSYCPRYCSQILHKRQWEERFRFWLRV